MVCPCLKAGCTEHDTLQENVVDVPPTEHRPGTVLVTAVAVPFKIAQDEVQEDSTDRTTDGDSFDLFSDDVSTTKNSHPHGSCHGPSKGVNRIRRAVPQLLLPKTS